MERAQLADELTDDERLANSFDYLNLGNYGSERIIAERQLEPGFHFENVQDIISAGVSGDPLDYAFRDLKESTKTIIKNIRNGSTYAKINFMRLPFNAMRFPDHHRYLYTSRPIVERVLTLLKQGKP
ncbi:hypothetical protein [Dyadobacter sp. MSC1_007]|jgi:hypothetical protein|uniref:hypothetical protein n=1 Tax=Dyadobacter sp. MSC1_007 TaxID=2909264 RepID=UPI00202E9828|nr:hypothetical protein [Dyadobacter sp. MSC1_007]